MILISRLCLSLEEMHMATTLSPPPRSSPWALETGWRLPLCLLLEMVCQELQLEILFLSSVRFTISLYIWLENFYRRRVLWWIFFMSSIWRNSPVRGDERHLETCREDEDTEIYPFSCSSWRRFSALRIILQLIRIQTDNALQESNWLEHDLHVTVIGAQWLECDVKNNVFSLTDLIDLVLRILT